MDNEVLITAALLGAGLLAYVIIPGLLVICDGYSTTWAGTEKRAKNKERQGHRAPAFLFL